MPATTYKVRNLTPGNKGGDAYGINVPRDIAAENSGVFFSCLRSSPFTEFRNEVIGKITETITQLPKRFAGQELHSMKKTLQALREEVNSIPDPLSHAIVYASGTKVQV